MGKAFCLRQISFVASCTLLRIFPPFNCRKKIFLDYHDHMSRPDCDSGVMGGTDKLCEVSGLCGLVHLTPDLKVLHRFCSSQVLVELRGAMLKGLEKCPSVGISPAYLALV